MPEEAHRSKFWVGAFGLVLCTVACGAISIYQQRAGQDLKPVINANLDSVYLFYFSLGNGSDCRGI